MIVYSNPKPGIRTPIIVMRHTDPDEDEKQFDPICGLWRIEAAIAPGETTIRAIVANESHKKPVQFAYLEGEYGRTAD